MSRFLLIAVLAAAAGLAPAQDSARDQRVELAPGVTVHFPAVAPAEAAPEAKAGIDIDERDLNLNDWTLFTGQRVAPYEPIRTERANNEITLRPNATEPAQSFGFITSPQVSTTASNDPGEVIGLRVTYRSPNPVVGQAPILRVRVATEDFRFYGEAGVTPSNFQTRPGRNVAVVMLDRTQLPGAALVRFYIDLVSIWPKGTQVDQDFAVVIERAQLLTVDEVNAPPTGNALRAAYMELDGDVYAEQANGNRRLLRENCESYAYDGSVVAVLDNGHLYAYDANAGFNRTDIETDNGDFVVAVAVTGPYVGYVEADGRTRVFNMQSRQLVTLFNNGANDVSAAGDGHTILVADTYPGSGGADLYAYDARQGGGNVVRLVDDGDVRLLRTRDTGVVD